jgi:hypothetical protein
LAWPRQLAVRKARDGVGGEQHGGGDGGSGNDTMAHRGISFGELNGANLRQIKSPVRPERFDFGEKIVQPPPIKPVIRQPATMSLT